MAVRARCARVRSAIARCSACARRAGRSSRRSPGRCRSACSASAILLLVRDANGSFAVAGRVVGAFGVANALGAVTQGRLMDRYGQPAVLRRAAPAHVLMLVALVVAAGRDAPSWVLALCALGAGAFLPQVPAAMRSLWSALVEDEDSRQTAYALVTIVFEVSVVTAPVARRADRRRRVARGRGRSRPPPSAGSAGSASR